VAFVACASEPLDVPSSAQEMAAGNGTIAFTSTGPGQVIIEDVTNQSIVYRGDVRTGDAVTVDPASDQVLLNGTIVENKALHNGDQYRILFNSASNEPRSMD